MKQLLIVDDMPVIADGLAEMLVEKTELELEIFRAYSVFEALEILKQVRIDIVLSDIKMPVKSGIDMLKEIRAQWPRCKVIFLTSYNEFDYARQTISLGGFDYILKTEGDSRIISAVEKAIDRLQNELEVESLVAKTREQCNQAKPVLRREYLTELLEGRRPTTEVLGKQFLQLDIPLDADVPVFLLFMRLDGRKDNTSYMEKVRQIYSVQNIMEDYLSGRVSLLPVSYNRTEHVWFIQPKKSRVMDDEEWDGIFRFIYGNLEAVQSMCLSLFKLKVSFMISAIPVGWEELSEAFLRMELLFKSGIGLNSEILTTDAELRKNSSRQNKSWAASETQQKGLQLNKFHSLAELLNSGQEEFFELYLELMTVLEDCEGNVGVKLEVYHYLSSIFLSYLNRWSMLAEISGRVDISYLTCFDESISWQSYNDFFSRLARMLFQIKFANQGEQTNKLVEELQVYISGHLYDDISLTQLGDVVHLNPSYLSRLYKQITGMGLSEYIAGQRLCKARELLCQNEMKIQEVAAALGYKSGTAFSRFFKKFAGTTPQEFREMKHEM